MTLQAAAWCHVRTQSPPRLAVMGTRIRKQMAGGGEPAPDSSPLGYRGQASGRTSSLITHQKCQKFRLPKYSLGTLKNALRALCRVKAQVLTFKSSGSKKHLITIYEGNL